MFVAVSPLCSWSVLPHISFSPIVKMDTENILTAIKYHVKFGIGSDGFSAATFP